MQYIDQIWYEKARTLGRVNLLAFLSIEKEYHRKQKERFLASQGEVTFEYLNVSNVDITTVKESYHLFKKEISSEKNEFIRLAYEEWCNEQLIMLDLIEAMQKRDDHGFREISKLLYGEPNEKVFSQILVNIDLFLKESTQKESVAYIRKALSEFSRADKPLFDNLSLAHHVEDQDALAIKERLQRALHEYKIEGWEVVIDQDSKNLSAYVDQDNRKVVIPEKRMMSKAHLEAIVVHEIGVHVRRRENAEKGTFGLLSLGLGNYLKGDEGLSKLEEVKVYAEAFLPSIEIYTGISLIWHKNYSFSEIFNFFKHYYLMSRYALHPTEEQAINHAWSRTAKFFRGTTAKTPGVCLTKDLLYIDGYLGILQVLNQNPDEERRLLLGKYDPGNALHRKVLDGLEI